MNNQLVFADDDHVNRSYALQLGPAFGSLIGCIGTEVPDWPRIHRGSPAISSWRNSTGPPIAAVCKAAVSAPYNSVVHDLGQLPMPVHAVPSCSVEPALRDARECSRPSGSQHENPYLPGRH